MKQQHRMGCPPMEELEEARHRSHLEGCLYCQTDLKMLREFEEATPERHERADVAAVVEGLRERWTPQRSAAVERGGWLKGAWLDGWTLPRLVGGLATLLLVAAVGWQWQTAKQWQAEQEGRLEALSEALSEGGVTRAAAEIRVEPQGEVAAVPGSLRWNAVAGAVRYEVSCTEVDGTLLAQATVDGKEWGLPSALRAAMLPGKTLLVGVRALDESGKVLAAVRGVELRLAGRAETKAQE